MSTIQDRDHDHDRDGSEPSRLDPDESALRPFLKRLEEGGSPELDRALASVPEEERNARGELFRDALDVRRLLARAAGELVVANQPAVNQPGHALHPGSLAPGHLVGGRWRLVRVQAEEARTVMFSAEQLADNRPVLVRVLAPGIALNEEARSRFLREGALATSIQHPRCILPLDAGLEDGRPYVVSEVVPDRSLGEWIETEGLPRISRAVDLTLDILEGLAAASAGGLLHRDVRPANVFVQPLQDRGVVGVDAGGHATSDTTTETSNDPDGRARIGNFGLLHLVPVCRDRAAPKDRSGEPAYVAPERFDGSTGGRFRDIHGLGCTLCFCLRGRLPEDERLPEDGRIDLVRTGVPRGLCRVVRRMIAGDPARRYPDLAAVERALRPYATTAPGPAPPSRYLASFLVDRLVVDLGLKLPWLVVWFHALAEVTPRSLLALFAAWAALEFLYYLVADGVAGGSPGTRLTSLALRTCSGGFPSPAAIVIRSLTQTACVFGPLAAAVGALGLDVLTVAWWPLFPLTMYLAGHLFLFSTLRRSTGYRTLSDLASHTAVRALPEPRDLSGQSLSRRR